MKFGLFSNGQRHNPIARDTYREDIEEIILADELGMSEAWISEHGTFVSHHAPDQMPCADLLICKAASMTKQIRLGPGIRPLPYFHPLQVATDCAVCDHLTDGRYMAGFGLGLGGAGEPRGKLPGPQRDMAHEAVDLILKAWTSPEPFDWNGTYWQGRNWKIIPKPFTRPRMDVGMAVSRSDTSAQLAAQKGFLPLMSWSNTGGYLGGLIKTYLETESPDDPPTRERVRVGKYIYVCDTIAEAKRDLHDADLGSARNRLDEFLPKGKQRAELTIDDLIDSGCFIVGPPDRVTKMLMEYYEECGGFGTLLLLAGKDWATPEKRERSMRAIMSEVAPKFAALRC